MALTQKKLKVFGNYGPCDEGGNPLKIVSLQVDFDSSYPTGGETLDLSSLISDIQGVIIEPKGGYYFEYDYDNKKIKAYNSVSAHTHVFTGSALAAHKHKALTVMGSQTAGDVSAFVGVQDGGGSDVSGVTAGHAGDGTDVDIETEEKTAGTPAGTNANNTVAAGSEVGNTTDLSGITGVRVLAWGV